MNEELIHVTETSTEYDGEGRIVKEVTTESVKTVPVEETVYHTASVCYDPDECDTCGCTGDCCDTVEVELGESGDDVFAFLEKATGVLSFVTACVLLYKAVRRD